MSPRTSSAFGGVLVAAALLTAVSGCGIVSVSGDVPGDADATPALFRVGGTVTGLTAGPLTLVNDASDSVTLVANGPFEFPVYLARGARYAVTVFLAPAGESCEVTDASGHVTDASVTDVHVTCRPSYAGRDAGGPRYSVGGHVTGLEGASVTLLNGVDSVTVKGDGSFSFPVRLPDGAPYAVTAYTPPAGHTCTGTHESGHIAGADVTDIVIACPSTLASLASLTTSAGPLSPAFTTSLLNYVAPPVIDPLLATSAPATITITATAVDADATILIDGAPTVSGVPSDPIPVPFGSKAATVVVTAADGTTTATYTLDLTGTAQEAYVKASNTTAGLEFGGILALSSDGNTLVVSAENDSSDATGINGDATNDAAPGSGAAHVFTRRGTAWSEQAYIKASNTRAGAWFGSALALSSDGNTLAIGSSGESSGATGIDGDQSDTSAPGFGAVYVFMRSGGAWSQIAYLKASTHVPFFGSTLALSGDGSTLAVADDSSYGTPLIFIFTATGATWSQETYIASPSVPSAPASEHFGQSLALSGDGATLAVGAYGDSSGATGINGNETDTSVPGSGAVFVFSRSGATWSQQAYVKASNPGRVDNFGFSVALSADGNTLAAGAYGESSGATGVNGNESDMSAPSAGAAYVFLRAGATWTQNAYVKASNPTPAAFFGNTVALAADGNTLAVGALLESSNATGVDGNQLNAEAGGSGAVYVFTRVSSGGPTWMQSAYVKPSNTTAGESFSYSLSLSGDGTTLASGTPRDSSSATGINGDETNAVDPGAGAVFVFQ
jgi:hypothetical protein